MRGLQADALLRRPVLLRGIRLGRVDDVLFDPDATRILGFDVLCGDALHRFLPFPAADISRDGLVVGSPLTLLDSEELAFYRRHGRSLADGGVRDAVVSPDGLVASEDGVGDGAGRC
jgi:hypothetical protein